MSNSQQELTETAYEPDDELAELLGELLNEASVSYGEHQDLDQDKAEINCSENRRWIFIMQGHGIAY